MKRQRKISAWKRAFFISCLCHGLFILILFCFQTAPAEQPEMTERYEIDLTQSLASQPETPADNPSDSVLPEDEQTLASTHSPMPHDEKNLNPSPQNPLPTIKPPKDPTNSKQNTQDPKVKKPIIKPIYPENFNPTKQPFKITLDIMILESGQPIVIKVKESSGIKELDNAAITAFKQWSYDPAINLDTGKPVSFGATISFKNSDFTYPEKSLSQQSL